jgi:hypothetical protein
MKYICGHERTRALLQPWAGSKRLAVAGFYFWNASTVMQKSQGDSSNLRSLLFEILRQSPTLTQTVCTSHRQDSSDFQPPEPWSRPQLLGAFRELAREARGDSKSASALVGWANTMETT